MKILVMGGTTFVSKCFAMLAIEKGYTVDIFTRGNKEVDYTGVNKHLIGDRKNKEDLNRLIIDSYDYVVDTSAYYAEDIELLHSVLNTDSLKRYVFCSTLSVYDKSVGVITTEDCSRGLSKEYGGEYGLNKTKAENYLMQSGMPYTIFRPTFIYGEHNIIYRDAYFFEAIENGSVNTVKDIYPTQFVYVWDLVKSFESCFNNSKSLNQAYNIAHPTPVNWSDLVKAAFYATGKEVKINIIEDSEVIKDGKQIYPFMNIDVFFSVDKLINDGLYVPDTPLNEGFAKAYEWYKTIDPKIINKRRFEIN